MSSTSRRPPGSTNTSSSSSSAVAASSLSSSSSFSLPRPNLSLGSQLTIPSDISLAGSITLGTGVVLHPTCSIHSLHSEGSILLGPGCLVSEHVKVINTLPREMKIGKGTVFESGAVLKDVIEVGDKCTFEVRCSVIGPGWSCGDAVVVGAGVKIGANASAAAGGSAMPTKQQKAKEQQRLGALLDLNIDEDETQSASAPLPPRIQVTEEGSSTDTVLAPDQLGQTRQQPEIEGGDKEEDEETIHIPSHTVLFCTSSTRIGTDSSATPSSRLASEEMAVQNEALHVKHMDYLRQVLPKAHKLKALV